MLTTEKNNNSDVVLDLTLEIEAALREVKQIQAGEIQPLSLDDI